MSEFDQISNTAAVIIGCQIILSLICLVFYVLYLSKVKHYAHFLAPRLAPSGWTGPDMGLVLSIFIFAILLTPFIKSGFTSFPQFSKDMVIVYTGFIFQVILLGGLFLLIGIRRKTDHLPCPFSLEEPHHTHHPRSRGKRIALLLFIGITAQFALWPVILVAGKANTEIMFLLGREQEMQTMVRILLHTDSITVLGILLVMAVVMAPVVEELVFRHFLYRFLKTRISWKAAMVTSSVAFACMHDAPFFNLIPLTLLGCGFVMIYEHQRTLWAPVIMHATFNLSQCILMFALKTGL